MYYAKLVIEQEEKMDFRLLLGYITTFAGMGSSTPPNIHSLYPLPLLDNEPVTPPIRNEAEAMDILNKLLKIHDKNG